MHHMTDDMGGGAPLLGRRVAIANRRLLAVVSDNELSAFGGKADIA